MGLGITRASLVSSVCEHTGDEGQDAVVKVRRLINEQGPQFCLITNWPFLRSDISFSITTAASTYSGASYLPTTFKRVVAGCLVDGTDRYPLNEVSIKASKKWPTPSDNSGRPDEFCITRIESNYWQISFNRIPDNTYTIEMEIELQWSDLTADASESLITKEYYPAFSHFVSMARFIQQGDTDNYLIAERRWFNPSAPRGTILGDILGSLSSPLRKKSVKMDKAYTAPFRPMQKDYDK
jgi:hypothetical protein